MSEYGYDTPQKLATALLDAKLVSVNSKPNDFTTPEDIYKNAVGSVVKKIRTHLHSSSTAKVQGEFIAAYCAHFQCSADYLFGYTEIQSGNPDIRNACKLTGLTEKAIVQLTKAREKVTGEATFRHKHWSRLLEGDLFISLPVDILAARSAEEKRVICKAAEDEIPKVLEGEDPSIIEFGMILSDQKKAIKKGKEYYAEYYGLLHKLSQNIVDEMVKFIEQQIIDEKVYENAVKMLRYWYQDLICEATGRPSPPMPDGYLQQKYWIGDIL